LTRIFKHVEWRGCIVPEHCEPRAISESRKPATIQYYPRSCSSEFKSRTTISKAWTLPSFLQHDCVEAWGYSCFRSDNAVFFQFHHTFGALSSRHYGFIFSRDITFLSHPKWNL
jgi:hypothetical protein